MWTLIREGGFGMVFVLLFGFIALGAAIRFAVRPARRQLAFIRGMSYATLFAVLSAICSDLAAVFHAIPGRFHEAPDWHLILILGLGEPYTGLFRVNPAALAEAIEFLGK